MVFNSSSSPRGFRQPSGEQRFLRQPEIRFGVEQPSLKPHEIFANMDLGPLAATHDASVVRSLEELEVVRGQLEFGGIGDRLRGAVHDVFALPHLAKVVARQLAEEVKGALAPFSDTPRLEYVSGRVNGLQVVPVPGWAAFNGHMMDVLNGIHLPVGRHSQFDQLRPNRNVEGAARQLANDLGRAESATLLPAHSLGGLISMLAAVQMEEEGRGDKVAGIIGISPVVGGTSDAIEALIDAIGGRLFPELDALKVNSSTIRKLENMSPEMRQRIVTIQYLGKSGDRVTTPERSFLPGSRMIVMHRPFGHESAGRHPNNPATSLARDIMNSYAVAYHRQCEPAYA